MKAYPHDNPKIKTVLDKISKYTKQAETMKMPYWVFMENLTPAGILTIGKEPVQLIEPPGTSMAILWLIDFKQSKEKIREFISQALDIAVKHEIKYALAHFYFDEKEAIEQFKVVGFEDFDDAYQMICPLGKSFQFSRELQFRQVQREEMRQFIKIASKFLQGSPDITLTKMLEHLLEVPNEFLNFYYTLERFYLAEKENRTIGIVNFNPKTGLISNIGVDPEQRGKGYGRQIMLFALNQLKNEGCRQARLRVHVKNERAIHLYESLGFVKKARFKTLIWRKQYFG